MSWESQRRRLAIGAASADETHSRPTMRSNECNPAKAAQIVLTGQPPSLRRSCEPRPHAMRLATGAKHRSANRREHCTPIPSWSHDTVLSANENVKSTQDGHPTARWRKPPRRPADCLADSGHLGPLAATPEHSAASQPTYNADTAERAKYLLLPQEGAGRCACIA